MEESEGSSMPRASLLPVPRVSASPLAQQCALPLGRLALMLVVLAYLGVVLIAPLAALAAQLGKLGLRPMVHSLVQPTALAALRMSLLLTVIATAVNAVVGTLGAIAVTRHRFLGRALINALADLPLAVSPVMIGLAFMLLVGRDGWFAPMFDASHIKVLFAFPGLLIATLFVTLPFTLREIAYVLEEIGTSEEEAAATLGASAWQTFFRVTLPNIRLGLGYGLLMTVARSLGEFGAVLVLGGSISQETQTATTFILDAMDERALGSACGMALLLASISVGLWLALEAVKRNAKVKR